MTKGRRLFRAALLLTMLLILLPPVRAGAEEIQFTMTGPTDTDVFHADEITVQIRSDSAFSTHGMGMTIAYDAEVLAPMKEACVVPEGFDLSGPMTLGEDTVLRISVRPSKDSSHTFAEGAVIAELKFEAMAPTNENTAVEMAALHLYGEDLGRIPVAPAEAVGFQVKPVAAEGVSLDQKTLTLELGTTATLTASVLPEKASDRTVTWTSSDADAVRVVDGRLEARKITTDPVTITVTTRDGGFHAQCSVQVVTPPDEEYVVSVPKTVKIATIKDDVVIPVTVSNAREDITAFNTFDIALTYDPASLEFVPDTAREGMKVEMGEGTLRILGWGASRRLDPEKAVAFTLTFHPLSMENPFVTIQSARVDFSDNALLANAAQATLHPEYDDVEISYRTEVQIGVYNVTANETLFAVDSYTANGESDFLIRLKDYAHYDYQDVTITIGGIDKTTAVDFDPETGEYTIPKELITGEVHITGRRTPKIYRVTFFRDEGQTRD